MEQFNLVVIGSGSGSVVAHADGNQGKMAFVEAGAFGGTCLNRGCIPTKMFVYTADLATDVQRASQFGLGATLNSVDWLAIRDRIMGRVDKISATGRLNWIESPDVTVYEGHARFTGPHELVINDETPIAAEQIVIATGAHPSIPPVVAKSGVAFHTSDTIMRLDNLPASMVILGGGYIAVEFAHVFSSLGVQIRLVEMGSSLLGNLDSDISRRFTELASDRWDVHLDATVTEIVDDDEVVLVLADGTRVAGELLLVAAGRRPNTEDLDVELAGASLHEDGRVVVDEFGRAGPGLWALGDCTSPFELKHVANAEARTVVHNLAHPEDLRPLPHQWVPSAVFSDPQVASVGARLQDLEGRRPFVQATQAYGDVAYGWALQDHSGFCRLYADPQTGTLLGAHILGYQASLLITPLIQAVAHGQRVADLARGQYWIHPALSEVVENALLKLPVDQQVQSGEVH